MKQEKIKKESEKNNLKKEINNKSFQKKEENQTGYIDTETLEKSANILHKLWNGAPQNKIH